MGRYVPKTYNNRRILRIIVRTIISVFFAAIILFILLFFGLRQYEEYTADGVRLEIPFLMDEPIAEEEGTRSSLLGFILGAITGAVQYRLLSKYGAVTSGVLNRKTALITTAQFMMPIIVLLLIAFLLQGDLAWAALGMAVSLIILALRRFIRSGKR